MYLAQIEEKRSGRILLTFARSQWVNGRSVKETVERIGYLDEFTHLYDDPIAHFKAEAKARTAAEKAAKAKKTLMFSYADRIDAEASGAKNIGYMPLSHLYQALKIDRFMLNRQRNLKIDFQLDAVMRLLVFGRILFPGSKQSTWAERDTLFERSNFELQHVYRSLDYLDRYADDLKTHLHRQVTALYGRHTEQVYYDVTNYYFHTDEEDLLRRKGVSKEQRRKAIVQMGLLMDQAGLPITYKLFSGNTNDCLTLMPILQELRQDYQVGRFIVVADRGLNTSNNVGMAVAKGDGYVYGQSIRKGSQAFQAYALDPSGFRAFGATDSGFKIKSRLEPRTLRFVDEHDNVVRIAVDEKQVIFYSPKYAARDKQKRAELLEKAHQLMQAPSKYDAATDNGARRYIKNFKVDRKTGVVLDGQVSLYLDEARIKAEEQYDGYYSIVSSEYERSDSEILELYKGLWKIEETFKITKSELETRPIHVWTKEHINAHFLTCFVSLLLLRLVERETKYQYPLCQLIETMKRMNGMLMGGGDYVFGYYTKVSEALGEAFGIDYSLKYRHQSEIKQLRKPR